MHTNPAAKRLGKNVRRLRRHEATRASQTIVANAIGVHQSAVSRIEKGEQEPSLSQLIRLGEFFSISLDSLVKEEIRP